MPDKKTPKKTVKKDRPVAPKRKPKPEPASVAIMAEAKPTRRLFRRFLAGLCVMLACVLLITTIYTLFIDRALLDTDVYAANMREIIKDPVVKRAVSTVAAEELFSALEVQKRITGFLPEKVKFAGAPASLWLQGFAQQEIEILLSKQQFQDLWVQVNRSTHKTVVSVLRGEPGNITLSDDGTVYVDLLPIVKDLALQFTEGTSIHELVSKIPDGGNGAALRVNLGKALSVTLPKDFGRVKVVQSKQLVQARQAVAVLEAAAKWLPWATLGLFVAAMGVSVSRRRTAMQLGAGIAASAIIGALALQVAVRQGLLMVADDTTRQLLTVIVDILIKGLPQVFYNVALVGIGLWAAAFIIGKKALFVRLDLWVRGYIGYASPEDLAKHPFIKLINEHVQELRLVVLFVGTVMLLLIGGWWGVAAFGAVLVIGEAKLRYLTGWQPF